MHSRTPTQLSFEFTRKNPDGYSGHCHYCGLRKPDLSVYSRYMKSNLWFHEKCYTTYITDGGVDMS